jgi:hypothetical protein
MLRRFKRGTIGCFVVLILVAVVFPFTGFGRSFLDLWHIGLIQAAISSPDDRKYDASRQGNLKAIYTALMLYHDSEGQFPVSSGWMDAIENRIQTIDMKKEEAQKKLIRPDLVSQPGAFGYSMNDAASGKYKGDLKDPKTVLVFESDQTVKNAHGTPPNDKHKMAVTIDGTVERM